MKRAKLCSIILVVMLLGLAVVPQMVAANTEPLRASEYIFSRQAAAVPLNYGQIRFDFQITGTSIMNQLGVTEIQILEQNGASWKTVETYRYQDYPNLMGNNTLRHTGSITFPGIAGRTYVAHITFYAANAKGSETQVITTSSVTAY